MDSGSALRLAGMTKVGAMTGKQLRSAFTLHLGVRLIHMQFWVHAFVEDTQDHDVGGRVW
jgi:hypothetical protein